jgi:ATP-binding cassette subfamily B protein
VVLINPLASFPARSGFFRFRPWIPSMFAATRSVWQLMHGSRARYAAAIAALVGASCFLYMVPLVPQAVIDGVLTEAPERSAIVDLTVSTLGGRDFLRDHLWVAAAVIVGLTALAGVFTYVRGRLSAQATETIVRRLRDRVYDHLQRLPCRYFDGAETGDLVQRCTSDVDTVRNFLASHVVEIGRALVMLFVPIPLMLAIDARMTGVALLLVPVITGFSVVFFLRVRAAFLQADEAEGRLTTTIQENLTGIRVVRAFARQAHEIEKFGERNREYQVLDERLYRLMARFWSISDLLTFMQTVAVVGAGIYLMAQGELPVGAFFYFLTAVGMFVYPMRQMGRIVTDLGKATVALGRLREILDTPEEPAPARPVQLPEVHGDIVLEDVTFAYGDAEPALRNVSLHVRARETVAFVGASGSGKSTIVALLLRLYDPTHGRVLLDGHDVRTLDPRVLRRHVGVAMQQPFLFSKTIEENLRLGRADAGRDEIVRATSTAVVHDTIAAFEDGYDTRVGERGVTLSGGQRQRVALARALLQRPSVLVLDDALSAVDTNTEASILAALEERRGRQTTILIAHRLSTVALADRIFVLDRGRIVQEGDHDTLRRAPGPYARLWRIQTEDDAPPSREVQRTATASS